MDSKPFWASKTIWVNFIAIVAAIAAAMGFDIGPELQATTVAFALGAANLAMRMISSKALTK